jgi:hypothetical protein
MGVTVKELSNPSAPLKDQLFVASTNIDRRTRVSDINEEAREKEEDETAGGNRRKGILRSGRSNDLTLSCCKYVVLFALDSCP